MLHNRTLIGRKGPCRNGYRKGGARVMSVMERKEPGQCNSDGEEGASM